MEADHVRYVLGKLGCDKISEDNDLKIVATCPFAEWSHKKGRDNKPSFYVNLNKNKNNNIPGYSCLSCMRRGSLLSLIYEVGELEGKIDTELYNFVKKFNPTTIDNLLAKLDLAKRLSQSFKLKSSNGGHHYYDACNKPDLSFSEQDAKIVIPKMEERELNIWFNPLNRKCIEYLTSPLRKLTLETIAIWELRYNDSDRICLPVRTLDGSLVGVTGRALNQKASIRYLHSDHIPTDYVLFGEHKAVPSDVAYLVEGHFDAIWLWQCGYRNVYATMGTNLSLYNAKKLAKRHNKIIIVMDGNEVGKKAAKTWKSLLDNIKTAIIAETPVGFDPNTLAPSTLKELLGEPRSKKMLTSWFDYRIFNLMSSLKTEYSEDFMVKECVRCHHKFDLAQQIFYGEKRNIKLKVGDGPILERDIQDTCDSCVLDIQRITKELFAIPDLYQSINNQELTMYTNKV